MAAKRAIRLSPSTARTFSGEFEVATATATPRLISACSVSTMPANGATSSIRSRISLRASPSTAGTFHNGKASSRSTSVALRPRKRCCASASVCRKPWRAANSFSASANSG